MNGSSIKYTEEKYLQGLDTYEDIKTKMKSITDDFTSYTEKAKQTENEHAPIAYNGMYEGIMSAIQNQLNIISAKLVTIEESIKQGKETVERYSKDEINEALAKELLVGTTSIYKNKYYEGFSNGEEATAIDYTNIDDEGYTPQGITYIGDKILISAYKKDGNSKIYVYDKNDSSKNYTIVLDTDAHVGGVTYDENNHVLLVTGEKGTVKAYDYDALNAINSDTNNMQYDKNETHEIDLNISKNNSIVLNSNINMNYTKNMAGNTTTGYNSATTFYDSKSNKIYIGRFAKEGKIICGDVEYDKTTGTYNITNEVTVSADSGIQGISTYHRDGKTYLVESRSYSSNKSEITIRDITNGVEKDVIVGSKVLDQKYAEGIFVDDTGKATIAFEHSDNKTQTVDINEIIDENNKGAVPIVITTSDYEVGDQEDKPEGYETI